MEERNRNELESVIARIEGVRALARRLVRDASDADDAVQDAVVAALGRPEGLTEVSDSWLRRVLRNGVIDARRVASRRRHRERERARSEGDHDEKESVLAAQRHQELAELVLALRDPSRSAILMRYFQDLSPSEIADRTGQTPAAVKKQLQRGLDQLRERLRSRYGAERRWALAFVPALGRLAPSTKVVPLSALAAIAVSGLLVTAVAIDLQGPSGRPDGGDVLSMPATVGSKAAHNRSPDAMPAVAAGERRRREIASPPKPPALEVVFRLRVMDERGRAIAGASAQWLDSDVSLDVASDLDGTMELRRTPWADRWVAVLVVDDGVHAPARFDWRGTPQQQTVELGDQVLRDPAEVGVRVCWGEGGQPMEDWSVGIVHDPVGRYRRRSFHSATVDGRASTAYLERVPHGRVTVTASHPSGASAIRQTVDLRPGSNPRIDLRYSGPDPSRRLGVRLVSSEPGPAPQIAPTSLRLERDGQTFGPPLGMGWQRIRFEDVDVAAHTLVLDHPRYEPRRLEGVFPGRTVEIPLVERATSGGR